MRQFIKTLALAAVAAVGALSCTESEVDDAMDPTTEGVTIYATTPSVAPQTKVSFEETDSNTEGEVGIALEWEAGDSFTLYDYSNNEVGTYTTTNGDGVFTSDQTTSLIESEIYTAKYNETVDLSEQNGDNINNLDDACQMEKKFEYYGTTPKLQFGHTKAIMTFTFKSDVRPAYLIFKNGDNNEYKVTYKDLEPVGGIYTSHIMIEPCDDTERTLTFSLYNDSGEAYDVRSVTSTKAYKKGYRYTAPISDLGSYKD